MAPAVLDEFEVAIVGGGPAGLSAALLLGRCRRRVVVFDAGQYRNADSRGVHGFLTRDGTPPAEMRRLARTELAAYASVELREATVTGAACTENGRFRLVVSDGREVAVRRLVLATGVADVLPDIPGARELHGERVVPCPYCDGWELRDQPLAAYGQPDERGARFAAAIHQWSHDVVLVTNGPASIPTRTREHLDRHGVIVDERPIVRVTPDGDGLRLWFDDGETRRRRAMFYHLGATTRSDLGARLGAQLEEHGGLTVDRYQATTVPGLFAVGDATRDVLQAIVAAGEGAAAAVRINEELCAEAW